MRNLAQSELYYQTDQFSLYHGDALDIVGRLEPASIDCIVTSPPYFGHRDYGVDGQYGLEESPEEYVYQLVKLFSALWRVLADDGTCWLNIGDSYCKKNLLGIPWRVALALQDDGWLLRNDVIWTKPNAIPQSATDRLTGRHEHVFLLTKSPKYWFDLDSVRVPYTGDRAVSRRRRSGHVNKSNSATAPWIPSDKGRNPGDVWSIANTPFKDAHCATYPIELPKRCILAGCKPGGVVLDPFSGSGTTGRAALETCRKYMGIDLNDEYLQLSLDSQKRLAPFKCQTTAA